MKHEEENLQIDCVTWFSWQYPAISHLLHHSPNGGKRNAREGARFKAMGTRAGFPDLLLCKPSKGYPGLFIEMKAGKGRQTESQRYYEEELSKQGYIYKLCRSLEEFRNIIKEYLS